MPSSSSDMNFHEKSLLAQSSSCLSVLTDVGQAGAVAVHAVHLEVSFAVVFDQCSRKESHEGDGQELSQRPPGEDVIQRGDLRQDGPRTNADEVIGDQADKHREEKNRHRYVEDRTGDVKEPVRSHREETKEKEEEK